MAGGMRRPHSPHKDTLKRRHALAGIQVSKSMVEAAQSSYDSWEEYGISDKDMERAIRAALDRMIGQLPDQKTDWTFLANWLEERMNPSTPHREQIEVFIERLREMAVTA